MYKETLPCNDLLSFKNWSEKDARKVIENYKKAEPIRKKLARDRLREEIAQEEAIARMEGHRRR